MKKRAYSALVIALLASVPLWCFSPLFGQEPSEKASEQTPSGKGAAEKSAKQQSGEKARAEGSVEESSISFPQSAGPVELRPVHAVHVTLNLSDSSRTIYEAIGKQAKISVLFDPDYVPRTISVDLNGVPFQDALKIVAFESRTFWRPVTGDAIFVAADTHSKRLEFEQQIVKTFYFPNVSSSSDLQDIVNGLRTIVEVQRIQQMPDYQTIVVRATPEQMAVAEKIMEDLNRSKEKTGGQYKLEFTINESDGEKKLNARTYTLLIEPHQSGKLRLGSKIPIQTSDKDKTYLEAGKNIDCQIRYETEHTVSLRTTVEFSDAGAEESGAAVDSGRNPVLQHLQMETSVTLELGAPTIVSSFQDPVSKHGFQIEVTAIRTKSKE